MKLNNFVDSFHEINALEISDALTKKIYFFVTGSLEGLQLTKFWGWFFFGRSGILVRRRPEGPAGF